ncbi:MAG TPA: site-specific DNA-methyltransferase [Pyrinomonadaceae bacterium]|nr:site-specific DNA-methyltransferase [Pyrinomonadaceae bacterium]HMP65993.1 site-specific DNA-methyltransferase [Pyrinomonadaceae bacterium]
MTKKIDSIEHKEEKRAYIPSKEEAGFEDANPHVRQGKRTLELPVNPVVTRGQDPELFWMNKYGNDDREELLRVDIRSLYRHEHIEPETLIRNLYRITEDTEDPQGDIFGEIPEAFKDMIERDDLEKVAGYYEHSDKWRNRLIQGDSHLVMASLLEREGMAGKVQMIYVDPPYGIKYGSNWQIKLNNRDVKDGSDDHLTGEPEVIKAFRDTWELGIHSYLSYIRDRLLIAKELLTESGSCFVQISDENVHLVRNVMDEVFGSGNFCGLIPFKKTTGFGSELIDSTYDFLLWYAKAKESVKYRTLYLDRPPDKTASAYSWIKETNGTYRRLKKSDFDDAGNIIVDHDFRFSTSSLMSSGESEKGSQPFVFEGKEYRPAKGTHWKTHQKGLNKLAETGRLIGVKNTLAYIRKENDFPLVTFDNVWNDTLQSTFAIEKLYVVQTTLKVLQRCILMTTDPGDLVFDPTCGSGTTAVVSEQFGRRWITIDTSRIALNIAKTRLMTATLPYYKLYDETAKDIRQGFVYKTVPHITLKSLANDEPPATETLYDKPEIDTKRMRVSGPFTVETLQNFEPVLPEEIAEETMVSGESFEQIIKDHLLATGIKNGRKDEQVMFSRVEILAGERLHAEGFYQNGVGEKKAYFHIGPKFGTVSKKAVNEAIRECQSRGDAQWLVILGFSFESDIEGGTHTTSMGNFEVTRARIHDDLLQEGLKKKPAKSAASFVTIGEPDIVLVSESTTPSGEAADTPPIQKGSFMQVEIRGLDIYDPIKDEVKARDLHDIAYWMVDDNYDGSNFIVRQVFFCGGDKDEFAKWKKGLDTLAKDKTRKRAEKTLKIEIDEEAFDRIYGHTSHPIKIKNEGQKIAVRVISQYGEESTKVLTV